MNPPYERKCHPEIIVKNVLDNVQPHTVAAFLLPDKKLEKVSKTTVKKILNKHRLLKIIKLPEKHLMKVLQLQFLFLKVAYLKIMKKYLHAILKMMGWKELKIKADRILNINGRALKINGLRL